MSIIVYFFLTLSLSSDAQIIIDKATFLPILNLEVGMTQFFISSSIFAIFLFVYFQLYMSTNIALLSTLRYKYPETNWTDVYPWLFNYLEFKNNHHKNKWIVIFQYHFSIWILPIFLIFVCLKTLKKHDPLISWVLLFCLLIGTSAVVFFWILNSQNQHKKKKFVYYIIIPFITLFAFCYIFCMSEFFEKKKPPFLHGILLADLQREKLIREEDEKYESLYWIDLNSSNLMGANLEGAILKRAYLKNANFKEANMTAINLDGANLESANLRKSILDSATMKNCDLRSADLRGAHLHGANLKGSNLIKAKMSWIMAGSKNTDFSYCDFYEATLENVNLSNADISNSQLHYANCKKGIFINTLFDGCELIRTDFEESYMNGASFINAETNQVIFKKAKLPLAKFINAKFGLADFSSATLTGADFSHAYLVNARFDNAILDDVIFLGSDLRGAEGLTIDQLSRSKTLYQATLDPIIREKILRKYPHLLDAPKKALNKKNFINIVYNNNIN